VRQALTVVVSAGNPVVELECNYRTSTGNGEEKLKRRNGGSHVPQEQGPGAS
jgi:hypothetical protein